MVLQSYLESFGFKVDSVTSGKHALSLLLKTSQEPHYGLVLMDGEMPGIDGYETCEKIRSNPKYRELIIIALSTHAMPDIKDKYLQVDMNDYVHKPF